MTSDTRPRIRRVLDEHAGLTVAAGSVAPGADLFAAGMGSHAIVNVMLALEDEFDVEFPDELLERSTFASIESIEDAVRGLLGG